MFLNLSPDFKDLLSAFNAHGVEYLVVGAHALAAHGYVRATGDLDVWVRPEPDNAKRAMAAAKKLGLGYEYRFTGYGELESSLARSAG